MEENKYNKVLLEVMEKDTQDQDMKESITGEAKKKLERRLTVDSQEDVGKIKKELEENTRTRLQSRMKNCEVRITKVEVIDEVKENATENESSSDEENGNDVVNVTHSFVKPQFMKVKNPPSPVRKAPPMPRHMLFEEEYVRNIEVTAKKFQKKLEKERKILERQKRKAEKIDVNKKYLGFGEVFDPVKAKLQKKAEKKSERDARRMRLLKIANGNKEEEEDIINQLLNDAERDASTGSFTSPSETAASSKPNFCFFLEDSGIASSHSSFSLDASHLYTSLKPIKQEISNMNTLENNNAVEFPSSSNNNHSNSEYYYHDDLQDLMM